MKIKNSIFLILIFVSATIAGESQFGLVNNTMGNVVLPYSSAGIARSYEVAHLDSVQVNMSNIASATDISYTTFSFNIGYNGIWGENRQQKTFIDHANFQGGRLAIPVMKKSLIFVMGLQPLTSIEQRLSSSLQSDTTDVTENLFIRGGLSRANFNFAYKLLPNLSVGLGYEYTFGKVSENVVVNIADDLDSEIDMVYDNKVYGNGLVFSIHSNPIENLNIGFVFRSPVLGELTKTGETLSDVLNADVTKDITLPAQINFGLEYKINNDYALGMDLIFQDWKNGYKIDDKTIAQHNTYYHIGAGFESKGSDRKFVKYSEQIDYRMGAYYNQLAQLYNNKSVNEMGLTLGMSLPIDKFRSKIDLSAFIAKRGDLGKNVLEETILGLGFSISANELWFVNIED
ncbi:MAG: hypothetical protein H6627_03855 [Calditrichae bacterium]|nr:hypothetical protein [Calditrichia bacterium]